MTGTLTIAAARRKPGPPARRALWKSGILGRSLRLGHIGGRCFKCRRSIGYSYTLVTLRPSDSSHTLTIIRPSTPIGIPFTRILTVWERLSIVIFSVALPNSFPFGAIMINWWVNVFPISSALSVSHIERTIHCLGPTAFSGISALLAVPMSSAQKAEIRDGFCSSSKRTSLPAPNSVSLGKLRSYNARCPTIGGAQTIIAHIRNSCLRNIATAGDIGSMWLEI